MEQRLGRRRPDMAQAYTTRCRRCGMSIAILMGLAFVLFGQPLSGLYTKDATCISICVEILWIVAFISGAVAESNEGGAKNLVRSDGKPRAGQSHMESPHGQDGQARAEQQYGVKGAGILHLRHFPHGAKPGAAKT